MHANSSNMPEVVNAHMRRVPDSSKMVLTEVYNIDHALRAVRREHHRSGLGGGAWMDALDSVSDVQLRLWRADKTVDSRSRCATLSLHDITFFKVIYLPILPDYVMVSGWEWQLIVFQLLQYENCARSVQFSRLIYMTRRRMPSRKIVACKPGGDCSSA